MDSLPIMGHGVMQAFHDFRTLNLNCLGHVCIVNYFLTLAAYFVQPKPQNFSTLSFNFILRLDERHPPKNTLTKSPNQP
jgi:hypothetical protein